MNPYNNNFGPFGFPRMGFPFPPFPPRRRTRIPLLDRQGIYELCTTGIEENVAGSYSVDYGVDPCIWKALPCECVVVWKVRHPISATGIALPVNVVVPKGSSSTVGGPANSSSVNGSKVPVVDNKSQQVAGGDVTTPIGQGTSIQRGYTTEHWVYVNKATDTFRLMGVTTGTNPVVNGGAAGGDTPAGGGDTPAAGGDTPAA